MFKNTISVINEYEIKYNQLQEQLKTDFLKNLKNELLQLKQSFPDLDVIYSIGYTPERNDGSECYHTHDFYINRHSTFDGLSYVYEILYNCYDINDADDMLSIPEKFRYNNMKLKSTDAEKIKVLLDGSLLSDMLEIVFDTNWLIMFEFENDEVKITINDYECGH